MKTVTRNLALLLGLVLFLGFSLYTSTKAKPNVDYSYVVIGAFEFEHNAKKFIKYAQSKDLIAEYALNENRGLFYVYTFYSPIKDLAITRVLKLREEHPDLNDSWVYSGPLQGFVENETLRPTTAEIEKAKKLIAGNNETLDEEGNFKSELTKEGDSDTGDESDSKEIIDNEDKVDNKIAKENMEEQKEPQTIGDVIDNNSIEEVNENPELNYTSQVRRYDLIIDGVAIPRMIDPSIKEPEIEEDFKVYVSTMNNLMGTEVIGPIEVLDPVRNKVINNQETHKLFGQNDPDNGSSAVQIVSRVFGFRPKSVTFSLTDPKSDTSDVAIIYGDSIIVNMPLFRLQKGDLAVMWNVLFYTDAAIIRPNSKAEMNSLLSMLDERDDARITLHGHTNGNSRGKIIYLGEDDYDFFTLKSEKHKETKGSAKNLSYRRAETIKKWLLNKGIDESRISVEGWGGKRMLHDKHDPKAYENVRVEVEVVN